MLVQNYANWLQAKDVHEVNEIVQELPKDWQCPVCGAPRASFQSQAVKVAGFAENQQYGFGGNSLTSGQKSLLIYGSLILFFGLFLAGYTLQ